MHSSKLIWGDRRYHLIVDLFRVYRLRPLLVLRVYLKVMKLVGLQNFKLTVMMPCSTSVGVIHPVMGLNVLEEMWIHINYF